MHQKERQNLLRQGGFGCAQLFYSLVLSFCLAPTALAQGVGFFGGYSYLRTAGTNYERLGINGWNAAFSATLGSWGVVADFSNHYGASTNYFTPIGNKGRGTTYLFGPQYSLRGIPRVTPFVHALFGGVEGARVTPGPLGPGGSCPAPACSGFTIIHERAFAMALGAGLDIKVSDHLWLRPIQADYIRQNFSDGTMNSPRISAGIVFRFGK
jgi:opacity protein-like surface antigen